MPLQHTALTVFPTPDVSTAQAVAVRVVGQSGGGPQDSPQVRGADGGCELADGHADGTWTRRLRELARPSVLDDFAIRELTSPGRRPLRTDQRTRRPLTNPDQQPQPGLVPTVPQPRRRRIPTRPTHQQQPPNPHERSQLPTHKRPDASSPRTPHHPHRLPTTGQTRRNSPIVHIRKIILNNSVSQPDGCFLIPLAAASQPRFLLATPMPLRSSCRRVEAGNSSRPRRDAGNY
jgi:hypothetical protein